MHVCPECDHETSSALELDDHRKIHTGDKSNECPECGYQSSSKLDLENHRKEHTGEKPEEGVSCNKSNIDKRYKCDLCELTFESEDAHKKYNVSHINEILYKCTECEYEGSSEDILAAHNKTKHNIFVCKTCDYKCKSQKTLNKHFKTHLSNGEDSVGSQSLKRDCPASPESILSEGANRSHKKSKN